MFTVVVITLDVDSDTTAAAQFPILSLGDVIATAFNST